MYHICSYRAPSESEITTFGYLERSTKSETSKGEASTGKTSNGETTTSAATTTSVKSTKADIQKILPILWHKENVCHSVRFL